MTQNRNRKPRCASAGLLIAAALTAIVPARAQLPAETDAALEEPAPPRYAVEVIIFRYAEEVGVGSEIFVPDVIEPQESPDPAAFPGEEPAHGEMPAAPATDAAAAARSADDTVAEEADPFHYELLAEDDLALARTFDRLDRLDVYEPLLHVGWTQTALQSEMTPALDLEELAASVPQGLDGSLTLYLSRFLHLVVDVSLAASGGGVEVVPDDVLYREPAVVYGDNRLGSDTDMQSRQPRYAPLRYEISEDRILKSGDLRYYDHPKFGVLARVERIEEPGTENGEAPAGDATPVEASSGN